MFKRRDRRPWWQIVGEFFWPRRGWRRAVQYLKHRVNRLPDTPERIARGISAGIFVSFSPLFTMHFIAAALMAMILRGNIIAALLATFFGNPITFVFIAAISLQTGHFLLGMGSAVDPDVHLSLGEVFMKAGGDLKHNFLAMFTEARANWGDLAVFYKQVFLPYLVGGILPGAITGLIGYYVSLPLIRAYKKRRKGMLADKLKSLKEKAAARADGTNKRD